MLGRKPVMSVALSAAAALSVVSSIVPGWHAFLFFRALEGIVFSGLPAVAMAYLAEEMDPLTIGLARGLYIGGHITLATTLPFIIAGIALATFGFFGAHSVLSSWVTLRAPHSKAQSSSLYLFSYYLGSSIVVPQAALCGVRTVGRALSFFSAVCCVLRWPSRSF
jgi:MFS family permease